MFGNVWVLAAFSIAAVFFASSLFKSYTDIQEAKHIQESYEIISDIKSLIATKYNRDTEDITRAEIIMHLPNGENWEKVLLLDRNISSTPTSNALDTNSLVNNEGKIVLSEDEKLKLLALKSRLSNIDTTTVTMTDKKEYEFNIGNLERNTVQKDISISENITFTIEFLSNELVYSDTTKTESELNALIDNAVTAYLPASDIYQTPKTGTAAEQLQAKEDYFKSRIKDILEKENNVMESKLYYQLKELL